ncbi:MAG: hypothetical protein AMS27_16300 [Bacteroides sp. SM23_62_1]|nr:MAG: hypothetical protein AMS27_16300 [Bacteroides sp. SM23_62_1]
MLRLLSCNILFLILLLSFTSEPARAQCFSAANPVGGSSNLLVLDKNTLRAISYYRHAFSNRYFEGSSRSEFDLVKKADYNYIGIILAFGLSQKLTIETEWGYYLNKTYDFGQDQLTGSGFNNIVLSGKFRILTDYANRFYISGSLGAKIPLSLNPEAENGIILDVDLQPSTNALGGIAQLFLVKENSLAGMRYFLISRYEYNASNRNDYRLGHAFITSLFISKHIPDHWIPGDWTAIVQVRNETRTKNIRQGIAEESTGGTVFFLSPQVNYSILEKWDLSLVFDIPVYQYFNGTQLAYNYAFTVNLSHDFQLF